VPPKVKNTLFTAYYSCLGTASLFYFPPTGVLPDVAEILILANGEASPFCLERLYISWIRLLHIFWTVFLHSVGMATMLCCTFSIFSRVFSWSNLSTCRLSCLFSWSVSFKSPCISINSCASFLKFSSRNFFIMQPTNSNYNMHIKHTGS
jgi:hypothetical protein